MEPINARKAPHHWLFPPQLRFWLQLSGLLSFLLVLSACQGTEWGERLGRAVQPVLPAASPPLPEPQPSFPVDPLPPSPPPTRIPTSSLAAALPTRGSRFVDLEAGSLVAHAVNTLDQLGVFADLTGNEFQPQRSIRRGEFARWLVLANNAIHAHDPSRQIRLGSASERPIFLDVPEEDPNFRYIQALGAAGLVEGDAQREFRPNSLLSRADLIRMKVPLDLPPGQVKGSRQELEERWGFSDAAAIPAEAVPALVADRSLNNASTVLRTFGPIRTFNPFQPVSRGEAAIALSAFGERTAQDALAQLATPFLSDPTSTPSPSAAQPEQTASPPPSPSPEPEATPSPPTHSAQSNPPEAVGEMITPNQSQPE